MAQVFPRTANLLSKLSVIVLVVLAVGGLGGLMAFAWSDSVRQVGVPIAQPVPFSHQLHVTGWGIDCRYCHSSVQVAANAGMPSTQTCMSCHAVQAVGKATLAPVRQSWATNQPIQWNTVYDVPDFVYFNHSAHVNKGVGCTTCHGTVQNMAVVYQEQAMYMSWCLDCHRNPEQFVRPIDEVFNHSWQPPANQLEVGRALVEEYNIQVHQLDNCAICHR